jgi:hypothetical protein
MSIKLLDHGENASLIEFTPRYDFRRHPILERQLLYGYWCPRCMNVIQAYFFTDKPIRVEVYEVTQILADSLVNRGSLVKKVPNREEPNSCYESVFHKTAGGNGQMIRLKNHTLVWKGHNNREKYFESGERPCNMIGWRSLTEKTYTRDFEMVFGRPGDMGLHPPTSAFIHNWLKEHLDYTVTSGAMSILPIGKGLPMLLVRRQQLRDGEMNVAFPLALKKDWAAFNAPGSPKKQDNMSCSAAVLTDEEAGPPEDEDTYDDDNDGDEEQEAMIG